MLKVWGRASSSNVQKVMWAVTEIGVPVERIDVGGPFGKNREAPYLAMNPNGLVPTLEEEDGFILWESNSIVRYLAAKHKSSLEPADLRTRALAQKWMDWQLTVMAPAIGPLFMGMVRTPAAERNAKAIDDTAGLGSATKARTSAGLGRRPVKSRLMRRKNSSSEDSGAEGTFMEASLPKISSSMKFRCGINRASIMAGRDAEAARRNLAARALISLRTLS